MQTLPNDVVFSILSRLPVKNLVRLKYVSKQWHTIITNPQFAKLQMQQSSRNNNNNIGNNTHKLLVLSKGSPPLSLDYENDDDEFVVSELEFPFNHNELVIESLGSSNGLLCITVGKKVVLLWNPCANQYKVLPGVDGCRGIYGFGYDSIHDDYKVVMSACYIGSDDHKGKVMMKVFSVKTNSWKSIEPPTYEVHLHSKNVLHGSFHWLASRNSPKDLSLKSFMFVAFNLAEEKFVGEVPLADFDGFRAQEMRVLDGCLCLYRSNCFDKYIEIWVMKEYMVRASWTKLHTVYGTTIPNAHRSLRPLCYSQNGFIFLETEHTGVVKYNLKTNVCTTTVLNLATNESNHHYASLGALTYVESLVSPLHQS